MKQKIAIVRGKYLNRYEMQSYEPLVDLYDITAFGSRTAFHSHFAFPTMHIASPLDLPGFPKKMPIINRLYGDAQYLFGLEKKLKGFAIAHTAETYFGLTHQALVAKQKGYVRKVIVTEWENIPFNNEGIRGRKELKEYAIAHADHFVAVSERARLALLLEGADEQKISVISPGINTTVFSPSQKNNKHSTQKKTLQLVFVGRLVKNKGIYELLDAFALLCKDPELTSFTIHLSLIGSGPEKQHLAFLSKRLGIADRVLFGEAGYDEMPDLYQKADIFVAPSKDDVYWQEQWGMALMEAQASGLPIVTTWSGSIVENVGDAAVLVQPGDVLSLFNALKTLVMKSDMRLLLSHKARERAERVHDRMIAAHKIQEVYEKVLHE